MNPEERATAGCGQRRVEAVFRGARGERRGEHDERRTGPSLALVDARNLVAGTRVPGGTFADGMANYRSRGMDFHHDVHDWLGGYPYESILPAEVDDFMNRAGLVRQASFLSKPTRGRTHGLLGSGCDEYRYGR